MKKAIKEEYIHYLWKNKLLLIYKLKLINGESIHVLDVGNHNENESGPDFLMASIKIDGVVWHGHVEIHVKASDWYKHQHHKDKNYNNVILHLVCTKDKDIFQNGQLIPTVEIQELIDEKHYNAYINFFKFKQEIFCAKKLSANYLTEFSKQCEKGFLSRIERKSVSRAGNNSNELFNRYAARVFGGSSNADLFEILYEKYMTENSSENNQEENELLITTIIGKSQPFDSHKKKGFRPQSNPKKRLSEWVLFTRLYKIEEELICFITNNNIDEAIMRLRNKLNAHYSSFILNNIIINALIPFLYNYSIINGHAINSNALINAYKDLPAENNKVTREWRKIGLAIKNAYESQACLEIYEQFCKRKQCLTCEVGKKIFFK